MSHGTHTPTLHLPNPLKLGLLALIGVAITDVNAADAAFSQDSELVHPGCAPEGDGGEQEEQAPKRADAVGHLLGEVLPLSPMKVAARSPAPIRGGGGRRPSSS